MAVNIFAQSRLPGSDGAYTDQVVVEVEDDTQLGWNLVPHDLGRIPDWVRVTRLTYGIPDASPEEGLPAHLEPAINVAASGVAGRLVWDEGTALPGTGRPGPMPANHDLSTDLWFGAEGNGRTTTKFLLEFGITHSVPK